MVIACIPCIQENLGKNKKTNKKTPQTHIEYIQGQINKI